MSVTLLEAFGEVPESDIEKEGASLDLVITSVVEKGNETINVFVRREKQIPLIDRALTFSPSIGVWLYSLPTKKRNEEGYAYFKARINTIEKAR